MLSSAKIRAEPPDEATVLVGYYKAEQYKWIKSTGLYNIRLDSKGLAMFGSKEAGAKYLLLRGSANKPEDTEIMQITGRAPVPISKKDLIDKGYPDKPSCDYYLLYQVAQINDNSFGGKKWDIKKLPGYSPNRANSTRPFAVTLTELSKAIVF